MANARKYLGPIDDDKAITTKEYISYAVPIATTDVAGIIKVGANLTITGDVLSATDTVYTLPTASDTVLGGIKVGANLTITGNVLSADTQTDTTKLSLSGGTMTGILYPQNNASYTTGQARRIILSTENPSGGSYGDVWIKYE